MRLHYFYPTTGGRDDGRELGKKKIRKGESEVGSDLEGERRRGEVKENIAVAVVSAASRSLAASCDY